MKHRTVYARHDEVIHVRRPSAAHSGGDDHFWGVIIGYAILGLIIIGIISIIWPFLVVIFIAKVIEAQN